MDGERQRKRNSRGDRRRLTIDVKFGGEGDDRTNASRCSLRRNDDLSRRLSACRLGGLVCPPARGLPAQTVDGREGNERERTPGLCRRLRPRQRPDEAYNRFTKPGLRRTTSSRHSVIAARRRAITLRRSAIMWPDRFTLSTILFVRH